MSERLNLVGKTFGRLSVLREWGKDKSGRMKYLCLCICGAIVVVASTHLVSGDTRSCGCLLSDKLKLPRAKDLTGKKFGRLLVIKRTLVGHWLCKCDCGNDVTVCMDNLKTGNTKSCGCIRKEHGSKHFNFDPNISEVERDVKRYKTIEHKIWSKEVKKRDSFSCQVCGRNGVVLAAHHLNGYRWCKKDRFETINGVTLCGTCHIKFHSKFGIKKNTKEQFEEFKKAQ